VAETSTGENEDAYEWDTVLRILHQWRNREEPFKTQQISYRLLELGILTIPKIYQLLMRYQQHYHPYYPLATPKIFETSRLAEMAQREVHLLTAILLISSKDLVEEPQVYESCSEYMKTLVSNSPQAVIADVEAVEALLILAEWAPLYPASIRKGGRGEEDKESWMHVGLALRIGYFLGLDKYSFRVVDDGKDSQHNRNGLFGQVKCSVIYESGKGLILGSASYISDRQISIRIGRPFGQEGKQGFPM